LEGQFAHHQQEEARAVSEDLTRAEQAQLTLADRLRGAEGRRLTLHLGGAVRVSGVVREGGAQWVAFAADGGGRGAGGPLGGRGVGGQWVALVADSGGRSAVVPLAAVVMLEGLPSRARLAEDSASSARGLGSVLREIARDRSMVHLETAGGAVTGRIAAVGADALDIRS